MIRDVVQDVFQDVVQGVFYKDAITGRAFSFDGGVSADKPRVNLGKPAATADIWSGGASVVCSLNLRSDGEVSGAHLFNKDRWLIQTKNEAAGFVALRFLKFFTGTDYDAVTNAVFDITKFYTIEFVYDSSLTTNDLAINYRCVTDGDTTWTSLAVGSGITRTTIPVGTAESDASFDLIMGNHPSLGRTLDALLFDVRIYDSTLTTADRAKLLTFDDTVTTAVQLANCQDTPTGEPTIITGTDYDMTGANTWGNYNLTGYNVNSTVANRMWLEGSGTAPEAAVLATISIMGGYYCSMNLRLKAGASQAMDISNYSSAPALIGSFSCTPTSTEGICSGLLKCTGALLAFGANAGFAGKEYEMRYPILRRLLATDSISGNDGIIWTNDSSFFAEGVQSWV